MTDLHDNVLPLVFPLPERLRQTYGAVNPFDLKPPTKRAFPGGAAEAIAYYETHHATCVAAEKTLSEAAEHCAKLVEQCDRAALALRKFSAEDLAEVGLPPTAASDMAEARNIAAPHIITFGSAAREYGAQRKLIEQAIAALRAAL